MRYGSERKEQTRQRIAQAAGKLFRRYGINGVGVDAIMREAGLTHGGFYLHFPSKDALADQVCADSLSRAAARWEQTVRNQKPQEALAEIVARYLSLEHVESTERGCLMPALGPELARRSGSRQAITEALRGMVGALGACMPRRNRERDALAKLSCMVGAVLLARLSEDPGLSSEVLQAAREAVLGGRPLDGS
ncbi:MAG: TetR/AcrR family transcriptional regulator, partial [Acetobacteraceae bacterium]|nr:TetR/AcrR family transcriptional regulator [Acetobacteraceae bacterium]